MGALNGHSKEDLLSAHYGPIPGYWKEHPLAPEIDEIAAGSFKRRNPPEIRGTGYVVKSLEAALWAFYWSNSFREGCLLAVNLGDDADTTGAIYGQLAGAFDGEQGIPQEWRARLAQRELRELLADRLFEMSGMSVAERCQWRRGLPRALATAKIRLPLRLTPCHHISASQSQEHFVSW